jgi:hypothetical protein
MPERLERILKIACLALALLLVFKTVNLVRGGDPVSQLQRSPTLTHTDPAPAEPDTAPAEKNAGRAPPGRPQAAPQLSPEIQAHVAYIQASEIFGPVPRPLPMALLGIAGRDAILRTANGQTGLLREGEELGGIKLLRIGTNRVLIEEQGEQKELMLFSGFGGESLVPNDKENQQ